MSTATPLENDDVVFLPENPLANSQDVSAPWKVLIVDDDEGVHAATRLSLQNIRFRNRGIAFIDAYSGKEALSCLAENEDIAVIFLDVVMETDDAGLRAVQAIREQGHPLPRIILRTGHPGYAPEREVVVQYDIHDYKEKTSLDFNKLFSCLISALRAYDDLRSLERHRRGLLSVLESVSWFDFRSLQRYLARMLAELSSLAAIEVDEILLAARPSRGGSKKLQAPTIGNTGIYCLADCTLNAPLGAAELSLIEETFSQHQPKSGPAGATFWVSSFGIDLLLFTRDPKALAQADEVLLEVFLTKVAHALDNHATFTDVLAERDVLVRNYVMHEEAWGGHSPDELAQMQHLARLTAQRLKERLHFPREIDDWFVYSIGTASGFHDLGLQSIPHQLFEKPGSLTSEEHQSLQGHVQAGVALMHQRLAGLNSDRLYRLAEDVIRQHHERMDGSGYPGHLKGEAIALSARIVGVIDTYVAMTSHRPYRSAFSPEAAQEHIRRHSGTLFDDRVAEALLDVLAEQRSAAGSTH